MPKGTRKRKEVPLSLARRHIESGEISPRKRGRPAPGYELGYIDAEGNFQPGQPPSTRKRRRRGPGRPAGSKNFRTNNGVSSEIERIVVREVESRLKAAKTAALQALSDALNV
ncbi:MAG TPA: hypothetical protein VEK08_00685 [Planctomycetota bacterium]|nr:hypothetical protein [Planctomycetota bacterium]